MLEAADLLRDDPVTFVTVGEGPEKERLRKQCLTRGLSNVEFFPGVARSGITGVLRQADGLYISLQRSPLFRFGISPNKLFDYMMAGRPIIQAIDAGNDIVRESACELTIPPEEPGALAAAVRYLMAIGEAERLRLGANGQTYVMEHHDYRKLASLFPMIADAGRRPRFNRWSCHPEARDEACYDHWRAPPVREGRHRFESTGGLQRI